MTMIVISIVTGVTLGFLYFGGLWVTVSRFMTDKKYSQFVLLLSFFARTTIILIGFYLLLQWTQQWQALAIALAAFVIGRVIITKIITNKAETANL